MTSSQQPEPDQSSRQGRRWLRISLIAGSIVIVGGAGVALAGWIFANERLSPIIARQLSKTLNRPVELGDIERLTFSGIRVGPSTIPPTATDPDTISLQAVEVNFNLLELLTRELRYDITLETVDAYIKQDANGQWIDLDIQQPEREPGEEPFIEFKPGTIRLANGSVTLVPYTPADTDTAVQLDAIQAEAVFSEADLQGDPQTPDDDVVIQAQAIAFKLQAESAAGGSIATQGSVVLPPADPLQDASESTAAAPEGIPQWADPVLQAADRLSQWRWPWGMAPAWAQRSVKGPSAKVNIRTQDLKLTEIRTLAQYYIPDDFPVDITSGLLSGNVDMAIVPDEPLALTGTARWRGGTVEVNGLPAPIQNVEVQSRFQDRQITLEDVAARLGDITAQGDGTIDLRNGYDLQAQFDPFTIAQITDLFEVDLPVDTAGSFIANVTMTGPLAEPEITTNLVSQDVTTIDKVQLANLSAQVVYADQALVLDNLQAIPTAGGQLSGRGRYDLGQPGRLEFQLTGQALPADAIAQPYGLPETVVLGPVSIDARASGPVDQLQGLVRWNAPAGTYPARGDIAIAGQTLRFQNTFVQVAGGTVSGDGTLANGAWDATVQARGIQLAQLGSTVAGVVAGNAQLSGSLSDLSLAGIQGQGDVNVALAAGTIAGQANLANGLWNANVQSSDLQLAQFSDNLQGTAAGRFALSGDVNNLSLAGIRGEGEFVASDGLATAAPLAPQLATVQEPLFGSVAWDGRDLRVRQAETAGISANGIITPQLEGPGAPTIANVDLNLLVNNYSLAALPVPDVVPLRGQASFDGRLRGSLDTLALVGDARLVDLAVSDLKFDPLLTGPVNVDLARGVDVNLQGTQDVIQVAYSFGQRNLDFTVRADDALATGRTRNNIFTADITNFPLSVLNLPPGGVANLGTVRGTVESAQITADLNKPTLVSQFAINDPGIGYIGFRGDTLRQSDRSSVSASRLEGQFSYANGVASLTNTRLTAKDSTYLLTGRYSQTGDPELMGQVTIERGEVQDILAALQIFELSDFGRGLKKPEWFRRYSPEELDALLAVFPAGQSQASLITQMRRLTEVLELQAAQSQADQSSALPPLTDLQGKFGGDVVISGSVDDLNAVFDLAGVDWSWGNAYHIDNIIAEGQYADGVVRLNPLRFSTRDSESPAFLNVNGEISLDPDDEVARSLNIDVKNVSISALPKVPSNIQGIIDANAILSGNLKNPQLRGSVELVDASINQNPVQSAGAQFIYQDARFNLNSAMVIDNPEDPLTLTASIPYRLPFAERKPDSEALSIKANVRDEGLSLLNLVNRQVTYESGKGDVNLEITGLWPDGSSLPDVANINIDGDAQLDDITLNALVLPEPLTDITGNIRFRGDRIIVDELSGNFSDGQISAVGALPLVIPVSQGDALFTGDSEAGIPADSNPSTETDQNQAAASPPDESEEPDNEMPDNADQNRPAAIETRPLPVDRDPADIPLTLTLDKIALNLKGLYDGQVDGRIRIGGSIFLLGPQLTGATVLSNGRISLPDSPNQAAAAQDVADRQADSDGFQSPPPKFINFNVRLADNVRVQVANVVDVQAKGNVAVNGVFPNIQPEGRINLPSGSINLYVTKFRLTGDENYAEFRPAMGLDPYLKATLRASVTDAEGGSGTNLTAGSPFPRNEISDAEADQLGLNQTGIRTVRIRAEADGPLSRLVNLQGVTLRSTPPRSEGEIVALISGGVLSTVESTLSGSGTNGLSVEQLLVFAGSAVLDRLQDVFGESAGLTDLRLYSATPESAQTSGNIDVGAEIGFQFSPTISVSVQKVFTNITPAQFNIRYRINDQFSVRGTTSYEDFTENSGLLLEYESRF